MSMKRKQSKESLLKEFKVVVDSGEQLPYKFGKDRTIIQGLPYGDYTLIYNGRLYHDQIVIERKSRVSELFAFSGSQRDRFCRELEKMKDVKYKYLLFEFSLLDIVNKQPPGILSASIVYSTICSFAIKYQIPFLFCDNRINARGITYKLLEFFFKYEVLEL